jgi:GNAT superfamily N-acetyltransferase
VDQQEVLALFDRQMRREARPETSSATISRVGGVIRHLGNDQDWNAIIWSDLSSSDADEAIAGEVAYFRTRGLELEWKLYGHDQPGDLGGRLLKAGFQPEDEETLMVAAISELDLDVRLPDGVRIEEVTGADGVDRVVTANEQSFGKSIPWLRPRLLSQLGDPATQILVAMAGDAPVSGARLELHEGTAFASLWGGGTVHAWRGKGIYRALVAYRARHAASLGYQYVQVDASSQSRPILERLGFSALTTTTPYQLS